MVQLASDAESGPSPDVGQSRSPQAIEGQLPIDVMDERLEFLLRKIVGEVVTQQVDRAIEVAVQRALSTASDRRRLVHDLTLVAELPLPTRIAKALRNMQVRTVAQLTAMREDEFLLSPNLGERSLEQLKHVLSLFGRTLSQPQSPTRKTYELKAGPK